jgi:hypothetical protein
VALPKGSLRGRIAADRGGLHLALNVFVATTLLWIVIRKWAGLNPIWAISAMLASSDPHVSQAIKSVRGRVINALLGCATGLAFLMLGGSRDWTLPLALATTALLSSYIVRVPVMWRQAPITGALGNLRRDRRWIKLFQRAFQPAELAEENRERDRSPLGIRDQVADPLGRQIRVGRVEVVIEDDRGVHRQVTLPPRRDCALRETQASQAQRASQYGGLAAVPGVLSPLASRKLTREDADAGHHLPHVDLARRFRRWARPEPRESTR